MMGKPFLFFSSKYIFLAVPIKLFFNEESLFWSFFFELLPFFDVFFSAVWLNTKDCMDCAWIGILWVHIVEKWFFHFFLYCVVFAEGGGIVVICNVVWAAHQVGGMWLWCCKNGKERREEEKIMNGKRNGKGKGVGMGPKGRRTTRRMKCTTDRTRTWLRERQGHEGRGVKSEGHLRDVV